MGSPDVQCAVPMDRFRHYQLVAGFTPARTGGREVMWHERALALRVVKKSIFMLFLAIVYQDYI
jgi:hypothetical protein